MREFLRGLGLDNRLIHLIEELENLQSIEKQSKEIPQKEASMSMTGEEIKEALKKGELPQEILDMIEAMPLNDPVSIEFQNEMRKLFKLMYTPISMNFRMEMNTDRGM